MSSVGTITKESTKESTGLDVEEASTTEALEALRPEWEALFERVPDATPFQSPGWLVPWRRAFDGGPLRTIVLRRGGRLVGLVPLYLYRAAPEEPRRLLLLGAGTTDYLDALIEPEHATDGAVAAFAHLDRHRDGWDACDLHGLHPSSPLLVAPVPEGWTDERRPYAACPVLTLPPSVDRYDEAIPPSFLKKLRYFRRRTDREGEVRLERATVETFEEHFEALAALHGARWAERDGSGVLADDAVRRFHAEAGPALVEKGLARFYRLTFDGRVVASYYGLRRGKRAFYYLSGFDPEHSKLSFGHQIVHYAVEDAIREGAETFDFLRGREDYKYRWGAEDRHTHRRLLKHPEGDPAA